MANLFWFIEDNEAVADSNVFEDMEYRFVRVDGSWENETDAELIYGPTCAVFESLDAAKAWAEATDARWAKSEAAEAKAAR